MCIWIIRNNSLVSGRALADARTSATERVTLYDTWRPSALTTRPHAQVPQGGTKHDFDVFASKIQLLSKKKSAVKNLVNFGSVTPES